LGPQDVRTGEETSDIESVMDGKLTAFVEAMLRHRTAAENEDAIKALGGSIE
jgi:hypothetical protein